MYPVIQCELLLHSSGLVPHQWGKAQEWTASSWVLGFINLPGHVMAGTATKKPWLHVNKIPEQVVGCTNHKALLQDVLWASLESYSEKEATSCETIWAGTTVILEFHQEGVGHNDMALEQSYLPCKWPDVWRGYKYCLEWDHRSLCTDSGQLYNGKRYKLHPRNLTGYSTLWSLQHIRYSSILPSQLVLCNIPL